MEYFCHFHPTSAARWRCSKCHRCFDHACAIPVASQHRSPPCPVCRAGLRPIQTETLAVSELSLLRGFLLTSPFVLLLCSTILIAAVSSLAPISSAILVLLNLLTVLFFCLHYGRQIVFSKVLTYETRTAGKHLSRARRRKNSSLSGIQDSLKITLPFGIILLLPVYIFYQLHWLAGVVMMLVAVALLPYMLFFMLHQLDAQHQTETRKLFAFLNTCKYRLIQLNLTLYFTCLIIADFAFIHSSASVALMLGNATATLCLVSLFYQHTRTYSAFIRETAFVSADLKTDNHRDRVNKQEMPATKALNTHSDKHPQLSTEIELALKTGHYENAVHLLEHALMQNPHSILRRQQLYLLLSELNDLKKLSRHAEPFLNWMLERGKIREASQFLYRIRKHDPDFVLHNLVLMAELAKQFTRQKKYALVLWLAESCHRRFAPDEALAAVYLSASQVLVTHYQDLAKAEELLLFVIKHCAACESAVAAKALLIHLQNNQSREQQLRE